MGVSNQLCDADKMEVESLISKLHCSKNFSCMAFGSESLCKAKDIGLEKYLECHENRPYRCEFSISFGRVCFCKCPVRIFISRKIEK